jgi:amidophosphoribosyltransferase
MCGVIGVMGHPRAVYLSYLGLRRLQPRGQESAGIVATDGESLVQKRGMGHVKDVFTDAEITNWPAHAAIGHNRYSTAGDSTIDEAQPFMQQTKFGKVAICHNGHLPHTAEQARQLLASGHGLVSTSDTAVVLGLLSQSEKDNVVDAFIDALSQVEGAYTMLLLTRDKLVAARDPYGFRPLALGKLDEGWVVASETAAFQLFEGKYEREVLPGEVLILTRDQAPQSLYPFPTTQPAECLFEHVYFARPDSKVFGSPVSSERLRMGRRLAQEHPVSADVVVGIPDSGMGAAFGFHEESKIPLRLGLTRDHHMGRTFIDPNYEIRGLKVKYKLSPVPDLLDGQRVVLVDDSIVRGNTIMEIIEMVRKAGAREVHVRSSSPPVISPCYQGIDTKSKDELIAAHLTIEEIGREIGADSLGYLSREGLLWAVGDPEGKRHCTSCFTGVYPIRVEGGTSKNQHEMVST